MERTQYSAYIYPAKPNNARLLRPNR